MKYVIKQLSPESWQQYRDIRLEGLRTDPLAFGGSYEQESARSELQWQEILNNMFFAVIDDTVVGMIGIIRNETGPAKHAAQIISFWVKPEYRGQGIGKTLIEHVQRFAQENDLRKLYLHVTETQNSAIKLYSFLGFEKVGTLKKHVHFDGRYLDQYVMEWHV